MATTDNGVQTVTFDELDRIFYEVLRKVMVANNYLPDIALYTDINAWQAALKTLADNKTLVQVLGVGTEDSRDEATYNKIIINRLGKKKGSVGGTGSFYFDTNVNAGVTTFDKKYYPENSITIEYEVRIITRSTTFDRILSQLIDNNLPYRNYVSTIASDGTNTGKLVLITFDGEVPLNTPEYNERIFKYSIVDVWVQQGKLIQANIPVMNSFDFTIYTEMDAEVGETFIIDELNTNPQNPTYFITEQPDDMGAKTKKLSDVTTSPDVSSMDYFVGVRHNLDGTFSNKKYTLSELVSLGRQKITVSATDGNSISDPYFLNNIISEIVTDKQTYQLDEDFSQTGDTITAINGNIAFYVGQKLTVKL